MNFDYLPHHNGVNKRIDWRNSIGCKVPFQCDDLNGEIEIVDLEDNHKGSVRLLTIRYNDKIKKITITDFCRGRFIRFLFANSKGEDVSNYHCCPKYNIGDIFEFQENGSQRITTYEVIDVKISKGRYCNNTPIYQLRCQKCGAVIEKEQGLIGGCPCCDSRYTYTGINDITITDPWMIKFFPDGIDQAKLYTAHSTKRIHPKCPICGKVSNKTASICNLNKGSFKCEYCSDGISFSERFFIAILQYLDCNYVYQASSVDLGFDACNKRYDFYFPEYKCIVETHGYQHYKYGYHDKLEAIQENDRFKLNIAIQNGIEKYIVIDCSDTSLESLKKKLCESDLFDILSIDNNIINWELCYKTASSNLTKQICDDYEYNYYSLQQLREKYHMTRKGICNALNRGNVIGWCNYQPIVTRFSPIDVYHDGVLLFSDKCASLVAERLSQEYKGNFTKQIVNNHIRSGKPYLDFSFVRIIDPKRQREVIRDVC